MGLSEGSSNHTVRGVFLLVLLFTAVLIFYVSSHVYFFADEWLVFHDRSLTTLDGWLEPHNKTHLIPGIVAWYHLLYSFVGIDHYWLYHIPGVALHLLAAWLLWRLMLDAYVNPWGAAAAASLFALYGAGSSNLVWAFQVGITGSLALGLLQLRVAATLSPSIGHDLLGLLAGAIALSFSALGVTMVFVAALTAFFARGWRAALFYSAPLGLVYVSWWFVYVRSARIDSDYGKPILWLQWIFHGFRETFATLGGWPPIGGLLFVAALFGIVSLISEVRSRTIHWKPLIPVIALAVGAVFMQFTSALGRVGQLLGGFFVLGPEGAAASRYIYIVAGLTIPLLAVAISALVRRWRFLIVPVVLVFAASLSVNVGYLVSLENSPAFAEKRQRAALNRVSDIAHSSLIHDIPADTLIPIPTGGKVQAGWLREQATGGKLPKVGGQTPTRRANAEAELVARAFITHLLTCERALSPGEFFDAGRDDIIKISGKVGGLASYVYEASDGVRAKPVEIRLLTTSGTALKILVPNAKLAIQAERNVSSIELCHEITMP